MLVAAPLGVALAIGLARWRGLMSKPSNFLMLFPLVTPEIVMGVALFLVFDNLYDFVPFGTWAQFLGHVTFSISFVVIVVRGRLFAIVFAISIDDFVISQFLIAGADSITIPVQLYSGARLAPPPSLNALATILMVVTIAAIVIAGLLFRALAKRRGESGSALESVAGFEM
jgi:spermidine/putrescine transport system permease protein